MPLARLLESYQPAHLKSHPVVRTDLYRRGRARLPSIAAFFSDAARARVLPLPLPVTTGGGGALPALLRRPGEEGGPKDVAPTAWATAVLSLETDEADPEGEQEEARSLPWLWVALGLVGLGMTELRLGTDDDEEEKRYLRGID